MSQIQAINQTIVSLNDRIHFLPKHVGKYFMQFESKMYYMADNYIKHYTGGYWEFYELSNGGFTIALDNAEPLIFSNPNNYFEAQLDSESASIVLTLMSLSELSFDYSRGSFAEKFHLLRNLALRHEKSTLIMQAID